MSPSSLNLPKIVSWLLILSHANSTPDAVQSVNIVGSTETQVMENFDFSLHIHGSPPLTLCWLIKTECVPLKGDQCQLVVTNATNYFLSHVFKDAGQYCLSVRVENMNTLLSYQEIQVRPSGTYPVFFVLPCVTLLSVMLGLAVYVTFRSNPQQKDLVEPSFRTLPTAPVMTHKNTAKMKRRISFWLKQSNCQEEIQQEAS